jgi:hypothetical protein
MLQAVLDWAAVVLPTLLAIVGVFVSVETPQFETNRARWIVRGGLIAFGVFVSVITAIQQKYAREETTQIKSLLGTIADAVKIGPRGSAQELATEIIRKIQPLQEQVDRLSRRESDTLYLDGLPAGRVAGMTLDDTKTVATFEVVTTARPFDFSKTYEFQNQKTLCSSPQQQPTAIATMGANQSFTYTNVTCKAIGPR